MDTKGRRSPPAIVSCSSCSSISVLFPKEGNRGCFIEKEREGDRDV